jgi:pimeloyl-ACP methyl ester carboxylesterase
VLPELERHHDVLAPTLVGHAGGPPLVGEVTGEVLPDAIERAMDDAGFETAHIVGNSLGGYVALQLAARGRARSVVAFAPAGGWMIGDPRFTQMLSDFPAAQQQLQPFASHAEMLLQLPGGRRRATQAVATNFAHIPTELIAHQIRGVVGCAALVPMVDFALADNYPVDAERITCPVRIVWGTDDRLLPWPSAAVRFRTESFPHADWIDLEGVGHCPQLDVPLEAAQLILGFTAG